MPDKFIVRCDDRYYRDTREESGHGGFSDVFTSSTDPSYATEYDSREDAEEWAAEFIGDFPYSIEPIDG